MTWLMFARILDAMSFLMTSTGLTPSLSARSFTDRVGGSMALRSPLASILTATEEGLKAERAASIAPGANGAAAFLRGIRRCWRKFTSSFWLIPSSRASSCAFMPERMIMPPRANSKLRAVLLRGQLRPKFGADGGLQRPLQCLLLARHLQA